MFKKIIIFCVFLSSVLSIGCFSTLISISKGMGTLGWKLVKTSGCLDYELKHFPYKARKLYGDRAKILVAANNAMDAHGYYIFRVINYQSWDVSSTFQGQLTEDNNAIASVTDEYYSFILSHRSNLSENIVAVLYKAKKKNEYVIYLHSEWINSKPQQIDNNNYPTLCPDEYVAKAILNGEFYGNIIDDIENELGEEDV